MKRWSVLAAALAATLGLAAAGCGSDEPSSEASSDTTATSDETGTSEETGTEDEMEGDLEGYVGPGFDISMEGTENAKPGEVTLVVEDKSASHNFHLTGPGVDVSTGVAEVGKQTFTITLQAGDYHYQCDPHSSQMNGDFTVSG